jgi:group I intron endonuclease
MKNKWYCIYRITNKINGKTYIGQHKYSDESNPMKGYKGSGKILHFAYKKYGEENFETEILYKRIRDKDTINAMEIWAIEKYKPEYNISPGGSKTMTSETAKKISTTMRGRAPNNKGKPWSEERRKKQEESWERRRQNGYTVSDETRAKISAANKGKPGATKGMKFPNRKRISDEGRKHISDALKGREITWGDKISKALKGKPKSPKESK